jgi:tRNA A-37 threonylcarbamoyl transferase component Bud32
MTPERWQRVGGLFDRAIAEPKASRTAFVRSSPEPGDVQEEVLALLAAHDSDDGFLEPAALLDAGTMVGGYRIERILGRGGMGVVYLAEDTRLHRPVALKALPPHLFRDDRMRSRLRQEARAAAALSHPGIATVYALEEVGDQPFIASEYLDGRTLREELADGPFPLALALRTARDIADALVAAHDRGIVHRDLKPENIVRASNGSVKILDFGLAQFDVATQDLASVTRLTEPGVMAGTPPYMAPEQLLGQPTSARTDQFAFGVLLYELLTGRHPFGNGALPTTIARVLASSLERDPAIPDGVWDVIERATQKKPEDRFASTEALALALRTNPLGPRGTSGTSGTSGTLGTPGTPGTLGTVGAVATDASWWRIHQLVAALAYWSMAWPAWEVHRWTGRYGVLIFLATIVTIVVSANLRLHLWFTSRTFPAEVPAQRQHVAHWIRAADWGFALLMVATGLVIADAHTGWAALLVAFGLGAALGFLVIEPTTARAVFRKA